MGGHFRNDTQQQGPNFTIDQTCNDTMQLIDVLLIMFNCGKNCILGNIFAKKKMISPHTEHDKVEKNDSQDCRQK